MKINKFKNMKKLLIFIFIVLTSFTAKAEIFYDIQFHDTLKEVIEKYPHANYKNINSALLKEKEKMIEISGLGINKINAVFTLESKNFGPRYITIDELSSKLSNKNKGKNIFQEIAENTLCAHSIEKEEIKNVKNECKTSFLVSSVQIVYNNPILKVKFNQRYGREEYCEKDINLYEICHFKDFSMYAKLTRNGKNILSATTDFTQLEKIKGYKSRNEPVPEWLESNR